MTTATLTRPSAGEQIAALAGATTAELESATADSFVTVAAAAATKLAERSANPRVLTRLAHDPRTLVRRAIIGAWEQAPVEVLAELARDPDATNARRAADRLADRLQGLPGTPANRRLLRRLVAGGPCPKAAASRLWELEVDKLDGLSAGEVLSRLVAGKPGTDRRRKLLWSQVERRMTARIDGPTEFIGLYDRAVLRTVELRMVDGDALMLRMVAGWSAWSRNYVHWREAAYVGGISGDGTGAWAVRVPPSCQSVDDALAAITPAEVRRAREAGKRVLRQGDVYIVECSRDGAGSVDRHTWDPATRTLSHPEHAPVCVPWPCRMVPQLRSGD